MHQHTLAGSGCVPDIGWWDGDWWVAWGALEGRLWLLMCHPDGSPTGQLRVVAEGSNTRLAFPRLCGPWLAYRADNGFAHLLNLDTDQTETVGLTAGNDPVCLSADRLAWQDGTWRIWTRSLTDPAPLRSRTGAPTGLSHFDTQGYPVLVDECRYVYRAGDGCLFASGTLTAGVVGTRPCLAGRYRSHVQAYDGQSGLITACEGDDAGGMGALVQDQWAREIRLWPGEVCNTPRCALSDDGRLLGVVTWGDAGIRLAVLNLATDLQPYVAPTVPPPAVPIIHRVSVQPQTGEAPLTVTAAVQIDQAWTWRWLLNGVIHPPHDGSLHVFTDLPAGTHAIQVRAQGTAATPVTSDPVTVQVTAPPPAPDPIPPPAPSYPEGRHGVQTGFGEVRGAQLCADVRARGWELARIEAAHTSDPLITAACVEEVLVAGLRPLTICRTELDLWSVPMWTDVEWQNEPDLGCWPGTRWSPTQYAVSLREVVRICDQQHLRLWVGSLSNLSVSALTWLEAVMSAVPEHIGISVHRYPHKNLTFGAANPGFASREAEVEALQTLIDGRPFLVSEYGYHQSGYRSCFRKVPPLTNQEIADRMAQETAFWREAGAEALVWYQVGEDGDLKYGLQTADGQWKEPQSRVAH